MQALRMEDLTLGQRIRLAREAARLTQPKLGGAVGKSVDRISAYEKDQGVPPGDVLGRIARTLGVTTDWLLFGGATGL